MSSSQAPTNYQMHSLAGFHEHTGDGRNLEQHLPRNNHHSSLGPSQMGVVGNAQFANFSCYPGVPQNGILGELKAEDESDPYHLAGQNIGTDHGPSITSMHQDHGDSISSIQGDHRGGSVVSLSTVPRANYNGGHAGTTSVSGGSEEASPSSNRAPGARLDGRFSDDFGLGGGEAVDGTDLGTRTKEEKNDPNPPWSELKTKAGKERKRLPLACIACRRKKIRCSGEKPACKHCLRSRIPCVYKVTTRKAAPRTDYMAMLDKRLKRMEERIIKIVPKEEQDNSVTVTRAIVKPAIPGTLPARTPIGKKRPADEAFGPELEAWSKTGTKNNVDGKGTSFQTQEAEESRLLTEGAESLPSKDIQEHLAEVFFENVYGQAYHLLHKPSFMRKLKAGNVPPVLILAVCATSARFSTHPKLNTSPAFLRGEEWAREARNIVLKRFEWPNITILICLLLLGLNEFGTCQGGRSWAFGGMAIRMAYALQLHKDLEYDPATSSGSSKNNTNATALSFVDREIRRRTMWSCFLMDRFNSSGTERPIFIKESSIKVQLPIKERYFQMDMPGPTEDLKGDVPNPVAPGAGQLSDAKDNMGVAAYMIRAIALWGRIIDYLNLGECDEDPHPMWHPNSGYASLMAQTEDFESTLPESLRYTPENLHTHETDVSSNQFLFLHIAIAQNKLFMSRFSLPTPSTDSPKEFMANVRTKAIEAANRISELLRDAESHFVTAPFIGYCAFLSSTVHIYGVFSRVPALEASSKQNLTTNVKYLSKMKRYWGIFHSMSESLKELFRVCADAALLGSSADCPTSKVFQYGDWFKDFPSGVSRSDYEDPASVVKQEKGEDAVLSEQPTYHTVEQFFQGISPPQCSGQDGSRLPKRKSKKGLNMLQKEQIEPLSPLNPNMPQNLQMQSPHPPPQQNYQSPSTSSNMYTQQQQQPQQYYSHSLPLPPPPQSILPQLDRQLVFPSYTDPYSNNAQNQSLIDVAAQWDMPLNDGMTHGFVTEPTSSWFMPFNMEPPETERGEMDIFNTMGGGYSSGLGLNVNNGNGIDHMNVNHGNGNGG